MQGQFEHINKAFNEVFQADKLSIGLVVPIENYGLSTTPQLKDHLQRVQLAEELGFKSVWLRDVPFHVPQFGDAGQTLDPFTYLGYLAAQTQSIGLGIASIALPLHHPAHVAKSAHTIELLSSGRLILGVASGDRYEEYPAMNFDYNTRDQAFRDAFEYIRMSAYDFPKLKGNQFGQWDRNVDLLPKPLNSKIPLLITGHSRQSLEWIAEHGDGWIYYPRNFYMQEHNIKEWRKLVKEKNAYGKPFMQPLYIDLQENDDQKPEHIHLGFKLGSKYLVEYIEKIKTLGVNHLALNLRFNNNDIDTTLDRLAKKVLSKFH